MQRPDTKKKPQSRAKKFESTAKLSHVTSPETYIAGRLAREASPSYRDPFADGPEAMVRLISAFTKFVKSGGMDQDLLGQFFTDQIAISISKGSSGGIKTDRKRGITTITLPKIPRQSPKGKADRIERLSIELTQKIPIALFNFFSEIIRGMPEDARHKLLSEYGNGK